MKIQFKLLCCIVWMLAGSPRAQARKVVQNIQINPSPALYGDTVTFTMHIKPSKVIRGEEVGFFYVKNQQPVGPLLCGTWVDKTGQASCTVASDAGDMVLGHNLAFQGVYIDDEDRSFFSDIVHHSLLIPSSTAFTKPSQPSSHQVEGSTAEWTVQIQPVENAPPPSGRVDFIERTSQQILCPHQPLDPTYLQAHCKRTLPFSAGRYHLRATYLPSEHDVYASSSAEHILYVQTVPTLTLEAPTQPIRAGQMVRLKITLRGYQPTGHIFLKQGPQIIRTLTLQPHVDVAYMIWETNVWPAGRYALEAFYEGDDFNTQQSDTQTITVQEQDPDPNAPPLDAPAPSYGCGCNSLGSFDGLDAVWNALLAATWGLSRLRRSVGK